MGERPGRPSGQFAVLAVCTGNIGRSPMMERILKQRLHDHVVDSGSQVEVTVSSAGTVAAPGSAMETGAARALRELGFDASGFAATQLGSDMVSASDLVLVATREHRSEVVALVPSAVRRTFTLRELARIAVTAPPVPGPTPLPAGAGDRMRLAVAWAAQVRGSVPHPDPETLDDLTDALGEPDEVYRERAAEVVSSVERILAYLLGDPSAG
jgi:protein-tyrosine phosphatase